MAQESEVWVIGTDADQGVHIQALQNNNPRTDLFPSGISRNSLLTNRGM